MFSNNHAKFHAFITKVNNSALFWTLAGRLICKCGNKNPTHSKILLSKYPDLKELYQDLYRKLLLSLILIYKE